MEEIIYPIRINKYLAVQQICSRKEADVLIAAGRVKINGRLAKLGDKVQKGDKVDANVFKKSLSYVLFNKPKGVMTHSPQRGEKQIHDFLGDNDDLFPLGRLDKASSGLILLTNDGRLTDRLLNPEYNHEKEYFVKTANPVTDTFLRKMESGVKMDDGYITKPCETRKLGEKRFAIILTEGKKHQIRRMCDALGQQVKGLERVRIMNVRLGNLLPGEARELVGQEREDFLKSVGL
jgi:23S rRNA pseudouridine2604 synthase